MGYGLANMTYDINQGMQQKEDRDLKVQKDQMNIDSAQQNMDIQANQEQRAQAGEQRNAEAHDANMEKVKADLEKMRQNAEASGMKAFYQQYIAGDKQGALDQWNARYKDRPDHQIKDINYDQQTGMFVLQKIDGSVQKIPERFTKLLFGDTSKPDSPYGASYGVIYNRQTGDVAYDVNKTKGGKTGGRVNPGKEVAMINLLAEVKFKGDKAKAEQFYRRHYVDKIDKMRADLRISMIKQGYEPEEIDSVFKQLEQNQSDASENGGTQAPAPTGRYNPATGEFEYYNR